MTDSGKTYVTTKDLDAKLDKLPSRWEVRFLILAGMIGAQVVPAHDVASAAIKALPF